MNSRAQDVRRVFENVIDPLRVRWRSVRRYRQRPHFARAFRAHMKRRCPGGHPMLRVWSDYAMTTVERGEEAVRIVDQRRPVRGLRSLDVGCAYGGFPIAFARAGAVEAVGLELDTQLLELGHELLRDLPCPARLLRGDAMDAGFMASLGSFDIITCNDVIEHVSDAWTLARHLATALRPGGVLCLWVPNSRAIQHVLSDPHYGLFGISLLSRSEAVEYYRNRFSEAYDVGEYYRLGEYVEALGRHSVACQVIDEPDLSLLRVERLAEQVRELDRTREDRISDCGADATTRERLRHALSAYVTEFSGLYTAWRNSSGAVEPARQLVLEYETAVWRLLGSKS
jgi:2-polyprenyl-3-methyl-5-hydroxy-6-metoxy-1,4-benzoquinol methylase